MQELAVGSVLEGKVTGITKFGAFVELPGGKTGMVHISEVTSAYVKEISDYLSYNQMVKVKILGVNPEGKISLSIKRVEENQLQSQGAPAGDRPRRDFSAPRGDRGDRPAPQRRSRPNVWSPKPVAPAGEMSFEDMISKFKQTSDDKMSDLKRVIDVKRGSGNRRGSNK